MSTRLQMSLFDAPNPEPQAQAVKEETVNQRLARYAREAAMIRQQAVREKNEQA